MAAVEALAAVVCEPGSRTTDPILRHALLSEAGALGRPLFALFTHPASAFTFIGSLRVADDSPVMQ
jgi:DnaJ family protein C protein 13